MYTSTNHYRLSRWSARIFCILVILALLTAVMPRELTAAALAKNTCEQTYQVKRGDTLQKIGERFGFAPNQIVYVNSLTSPYTIYVGQKLCIPEKVESSAPKIDSKFTNSTAAYFTAGRSGADILIYTYNYPKTSVLVKARDANQTAKNFFTLGSINIAQTGNGRTFRVKTPVSLQKAKQLQICLKDLTTSYLQCVYPRSGS
jgi:LysM repeat protein